MGSFVIRLCCWSSLVMRNLYSAWPLVPMSCANLRKAQHSSQELLGQRDNSRLT